MLHLPLLHLPIETQHTASNENSFHSLTLVVASALIPNSFSENTNDILIVPTFGLNYDYQINLNWGFGLHTDIILQEYKIEKHGG